MNISDTSYRIFAEHDTTQTDPPQQTENGKNRAFCRFLCTGVCFVLFLWYQELVFHIMYFGMPSLRFIYPMLFAVPIGGVTAVLTGLFPKTYINRTIAWVLVSMQCLVFSVQAVYYSIFKSFLSLSLVGNGGDAVTNFARETFSAIAESWWRILIFCLPLIALGVLMKIEYIDCRRVHWSWSCFLALGSAVAHVVALLSLYIYGVSAYTPYDRYYNTWVLDSNISELGLLTTTRLELQSMLFGDVQQTEIKKPSQNINQFLNPDLSNSSSSGEASWDTSPNVMNIDFLALAAGESNTTVKQLHEYFSVMSGTRKNQYTGMFEGYNLIMICAEAFSPYAIDKDLTPTLYRMTQEGFIFNNFYTMFPSVTTNGEYAFCTGLIPDMSRQKTEGSFDASKNNWLPFCMGNQFKSIGYPTRAYHDYSYTYYNRHLTHPNMGYVFKGAGKGLKYSKSDYDMMLQSIPEYIGDQPFHTYYMTVSGHLAYRFDYGNEIADMNREAVSHLPYSKNVQAYLSCNLEFEKAMAELLAGLEAAGVADRTVIAITTDHYPYGLHLWEYEELAGHKVDEAFGKYKSTFILWNPAMDPVEVNDPCCTIDILPTLSNLFGLEYDSRLLMGTDILSDTLPIAILSNQSFITEKIRFNSSTGKVEYLVDPSQVSDGYVKAIMEYVRGKFDVSTAILNTDYYSYVIPRRK